MLKTRNFSNAAFKSLVLCLILFVGGLTIVPANTVNGKQSPTMSQRFVGFSSGVPTRAYPSKVMNFGAVSFNTANNPAVMDVTWNPAKSDTGLAGYILERATNPDFIDQKVYILDAVTGYRDKTVETAVMYYWRIKARDFAGNLSPTWATLAKATLPVPVVNKQLIIEGDSTSTGAYMPGWVLYTIYSPERWGYKIGDLLDGSWVVRTVARDGGRILGDIPFDRAAQVTAFRQPGFVRDVVFVWAGSNDIYGVASAGAYPAASIDVYQGLRSYVSSVRNDGFEVWIADAHKRNPDITDENSNRIAFNNLIRTDNSFADRFIDIDSWAEFQNQSDPTYYYADGTHFSLQGNQLIANRIFEQLVGTVRKGKPNR